MGKRVVDEASLTTVADAIRKKAGTTDTLVFPDGFSSAIDAIQTGGGGGGGGEFVYAKEVNFYDYDGTLLHSYTVEEAQALTELPELPTQEGLICLGWNWSLDSIKEHNRAVDVGAMYTTDDGTTRIYIHLEEGRTSPMLGVSPNGTVTVDWGDGTAPDVLTGTSTGTYAVKWTPNHEYAKPGDYVITLTVDGTMGFGGSYSANQYTYLLRHASGSDTRNIAYQNTVQKIEIGSGVTYIGTSAFERCCSLTSIIIPNSINSINTYAFRSCYSLSSLVIPDGVTSIYSAFSYCYSLSSIIIPDGVTTIDSFSSCYSLSSLVIPDGVTSINSSEFQDCQSLSSLVIPDSVTNISGGAFNRCHSLSSIVIPDSVTSINSNAFNNCYGIRYCDFSNHTVVPTLANTNAFNNIPDDCEIRVPAALYDEWIAATNWSTYASKIVAV